MIGLGSNRLSVCRRGGMSVTQAGRGGMEWLAGGRVPLWAQWWLPYSRQAGEALKAQFPTQWPTIRDYGVAHPEIVPFINEDPMLVCSLGLQSQGVTMPDRIIKVADGHPYIETGVFFTDDNWQLITVHAKLEYPDTIASSGESNALSNEVGGRGFNFGFAANNILTTWCNGSLQVSGVSGMIDTYFIFSRSLGYRYLSIAPSSHGGIGTPTNPNMNMRLFTLGNNGYIDARTYYGGMAKMSMDVDGTMLFDMVPFKHKTGENTYECGMLNLANVGIDGAQTFYGKSGSGSFTISETPAS